MLLFVFILSELFEGKDPYYIAEKQFMKLDMFEHTYTHTYARTHMHARIHMHARTHTSSTLRTHATNIHYQYSYSIHKTRIRYYMTHYYLPH